MKPKNLELSSPTVGYHCSEAWHINASQTPSIMMMAAFNLTPICTSLKEKEANITIKINRRVAFPFIAAKLVAYGRTLAIRLNYRCFESPHF